MNPTQELFKELFEFYALDDKIRDLIRQGANVNARINEEKITPLMCAAQEQRAEIVQLLIDYGALVDTRNSKGITALMLAALDNEESVVYTLINAGADVNAVDKKGHAVLTYGLNNRNPRVAQLLIEAGAKE